MKNAWIRKLVSFVLCAVMVFAAGAYGAVRLLPIAAEEAAGVSVDNASPAPGGTFTVTVFFPAMQEQFDAADLKVRFDKTLVEATAVTASSITGAGKQSSTAEEANGKGYFSASYMATEGDPIDFPGVTVTATFRVKDSVAVGTAVTFTADTNDFYISRYDPDAFDDVDVMPAGAVRSVTVTVTAAQTAAVIETASLSLLDAIGVNFYTILPDAVKNDAGAYALFDGPNGEQKIFVKDAVTGTDGRTVFTYAVYAKETGDEITIRLFDGTGAPIDMVCGDAAHTPIGSEGYSYSVDEYLAAIAAGSEGAEMKALAAALADYGAAADRLFGYSGANAPAVAADLSAITAESLAAYKLTQSGTAPDGFSLTGATLMLESETTLRIYFNAQTVPSVTVDGTAVTPVQKGNAYYVAIPNILAKELGTPHVVRFGNYEITCSALTYAYSVLRAYPESDTSDEAVNLRTLARALVRYQQTAVAYFESK